MSQGTTQLAKHGGLPERLALRLEVEDFLYHEADLLDRWQLREWHALFAVDGYYLVPTPDLPDCDPSRDLALIAEDTYLLEGRVDRLLSNYAHIENPKSRLRHTISNVKVSPTGSHTVAVRAGFVVHRGRADGTTRYVGEYTYELRREADSFSIVSKRATLDHWTLRDSGGVLSILL